MTRARSLDPPRWLPIVSVVLIAGVFLLLRVNPSRIPLDRDEGAFGLIGQAILDGKTPYLDIADHKPPVAFYLYAAALLAVPPTPLGVHTFLHATNALTLAALFFLARGLSGSAAAGLWCAFAYAVVSIDPALQGFTASTEMLMLLPVTLSAVAALLWARSRRAPLLLLSGLAAGLAVMTKQTALTSILFAPVLAFSQASPARAGLTAASSRKPPPGSSKPRARIAPWAALWVAGMVIPFLGFSLWFWYKGGFTDFAYWSFTHNLGYASEVNRGLWWHKMGIALGGLAKAQAPLMAACAVALIMGLRRRSRPLLLAGVFVLLCALGTLPGQAYRHYFAQLAPALALLGGLGCHELARAASGVAARRLAAASLAALILLVPVAVNRRYFAGGSPEELSRLMFAWNAFAESQTAAQYLRSHTRPEDQVLIAGSEPQILFYAERRSANPFIMIYPYTRGGRAREFQDRLMQQLRRDPPAYILLVKGSASLPSLLWDGKTDISFLAEIETLAQKSYSIEAIVLAGAPGGRLVTKAENLDLKVEELARSPLSIYFLRNAALRGA